jgi:hypothetical protein
LPAEQADAHIRLQQQQHEQQQRLQCQMQQQLVGRWTGLLQGIFQQRMLQLYGPGWQQYATAAQQLCELCKVESSMVSSWPLLQQQQGGQEEAAAAPELHLQQQLLTAQVTQQVLGVQEAFPGWEQDAAQIHAWLQELRAPHLQNLAATAADSHLVGQKYLSAGLLASQLAVGTRNALHCRKGHCSE